MSRLQSIENALKSINEAVFQELCDSFLIRKNENYRAFSRTGSQSGKQKTTKGTPDTFLLLPNGKYIFVEYSTNITKGVSKLQEDIEKCLDVTKTKIPTNRIAEIIICINFNLNTEEILYLQNLLPKKITFYTLDSLAQELHWQHRDLVHRYLNLPLDTGQIVSIDTFIEEYNKAANAIATPLDSTFLHREKELDSIKKLISQNDFLIITGAAGVGKTKIAIEAANIFITENLSYDAYCISDKNGELLDDLHQYFDNNGNYILLVDDANRIDRIRQITGSYKSKRAGNLKIILTVRDYAVSIVRDICQEYALAEFILTKFTDEDIIDIIKAEPFEITDTRVHKEITRIADGNPRLAIMTALLAKQNIRALADVSDLFEKYFSTFVKDNREFNNPFNIKCLGIIAFFYAIPKERSVIEPILQVFGIDYFLFIDAIGKLDKLELVEVQYEYVKIPEQNLATFFFYKAFVKDNLLSFETLLQNYFEKNKGRLEDCVISTNNTFGYENVMQKLQPALRNHLRAIRNEDESVFVFLDVFWGYLQDETLLFVDNFVNKLPFPETPVFKTVYDASKFGYSQNKVIKLVANFFQYKEKLNDALELLFEYVRKMPEHFPELIHRIKEKLAFGRTEEIYGFQRQGILFQILINGLDKKDTLYSTAFYELSKTFLDCQFRYVEGGRKNSIILYTCTILDNQQIRDFRKNIWDSVNHNFQNYSEQSFDLMLHYNQSSYRYEKAIQQYDILFITEIIENYFTPESFKHCKYVHDLIRRCKREKIKHDKLAYLSEKFTTPTYDVYLLLDWDRFRDKERFDFDDYDEYKKLKEKEIRKSFVFNSISEIKSFYNTFVYLKSVAKNGYNYNNALDIIIDENCAKNFELGCQILHEIIESKNQVYYTPRIVFQNQLVTEEKSEYIWDILQANDFDNKYLWELSFYFLLADALGSKKQIDRIRHTVVNLPNRSEIWIDRLERYLQFEPNLFQELLKILVERNEKEDKSIVVYLDYTEKCLDLIDDFDLIKKTYLQQSLFQDHFDYAKKGFLKIMQQDTSFLIDYISLLFSKEQNSYSLRTENDLNVIWEIDNVEPVLKVAFDIIIEKDGYFGVSEHFCDSFFMDLSKEKKERAKKFILNYCRENYNNPQRIDVLASITRSVEIDLFEEFLLLFISLTQDEKLFSEIWWVGRGGVYGDVIIGDINAAKWRNILSIVNKSNLGRKLLPIKQYINNQIECLLKQAEWERQSKFIRNG